MLKAHSFPRVIYPKSLWGFIHAQGLSMRRAHICCCRAYPFRGLMGVHPCPEPTNAKGPYLPGVYPSRWPIGAHLLPGPIPAQDPSIPRTHGGLSIPRAHPYQDPYLPRAYPSRGPIGAHLCPRFINVEGPSPRGPIHYQGLSMPRARPSRRPMGPIHP